jgi:hypothetical protein
LGVPRGETSKAAHRRVHPDVAIAASGETRHEQLQRAAGSAGDEAEDGQFSYRGSLPAMPERLDRVTVALGDREVIVSWNTREALMAQMQDFDATELREAFDAVGATRPVELGPSQRDALLQLLEAWSRDEDPMPKELVELRDALIDGFDETERSE